MSLQVFPDTQAAAAGCADFAAEQLAEAIDTRGYAAVAISGGSSPKPMFARLRDAKLPWDRIHVFWVDERAVTPTDPESNYKLAADWLLDHVSIPERNVHRVRAELAPEEAASAYVQEIRAFFGLRSGEIPEFDFMHRGMGPDGHTASLFPGEPLITDRAGIAAAVYSKPRSQWRITLLPAPILAARSTAMLITGVDKAEPLRAVFREPLDPLQRPAQLLPSEGHEVAWFLDQAAARLLSTATA